MPTNYWTAANLVVLASFGLVGVSGCGRCEELPSRTFSLGDGIQIRAFSRAGDGPGYSDRAVAVGEDGVVVVWQQEDSSEAFVPISHPVDVTLHNVDGRYQESMIVGAEGTVLASRPLSDHWEWDPVDVGVTADLWAIADVGSELGEWIVIVGDDVVVSAELTVQPSEGFEPLTSFGPWVEAPPPAGGWGQLRAVFSDGTQIFAVGLGGVAWSTKDPRLEWTAEDTGVSTDLLAGGDTSRRAPSGVAAAVGVGGTVVVHDDDGWRKVETGFEDDIVDYDDGNVLTVDGRVYGFDDDEALEYWFDLEPEGNYRGFGWWGFHVAAVTDESIAHEFDAWCTLLKQH
jgi:hypothetical protein